MKNNLIYPELSYKIIGIAFKVFNKLGYGHQEKYFQRAMALEFDKEGIEYEREKEIELLYDNQNIGRYFLDFIVERKILLELKVTPQMKHIHIRKTLEYLNEAKLKLAILIYFTKEGVRYRRIINPKLALD
jgi:GxxExxY protein